MNHAMVNMRALELALTALLGSERVQVVLDLYKLLDNTETNAHQEGFQQGYKAGEEDGDQDNYYTGYDHGFQAGVDSGNIRSVKDDQPYFYEDYHCEGAVTGRLHGTAAALEPHETEQAPTPPADSPF